MIRHNKYHAKKTVIDGIRFDSKLEAARYRELQLLQFAGEIYCLRCQPSFVLQEGFRDDWSGVSKRAIKYTADFSYVVWGDAAHLVVEDVKSKMTAKKADFNIRWRLAMRQNPSIEFKITGV